MNVSSCATVGGCGSVSQYPVVSVLTAQYLQWLGWCVGQTLHQHPPQVPLCWRVLVRCTLESHRWQVHRSILVATYLSNVNGVGWTGDLPLYTIASPGTGSCDGMFSWLSDAEDG